MRAGVAAAAVLVLALAVSGCGGSNDASKSARRTAVTEYIKRVDTVEQQLRYPLLKVEKTYKALTTNASTLKRSGAKLAGVKATLHTVQIRLSFIGRPSPSR